MQWSKLKQQIESRFAAALRGRLAIHQARYRNSREEHGRVWLTIDGVEVGEFSSAKGHRQRAEVSDALNEANGTQNYSITSQLPGYRESDQQARQIGRQSGVITDHEAVEQLKEYLLLSIEEAQGSDSPLIRALALADGRTGKRRLGILTPGPNEHSLVKAVYEFRRTSTISTSDGLDA